MSHGMKHGSETFFIEGEGLLTTQVGGRTGDEGDPLSQSENPKAGRPRALPAADAASVPVLQGRSQGSPPERDHHQEAGPRHGRRRRG